MPNNYPLLHKNTSRGGSAAQFPGKLHDMLAYMDRHDIRGIISWNNDGRSFTIHDPGNLVKILPIFFEQTKYRSFRRQLNMWHFKRILDGPNKDGFYHPFFVRGDKDLCAYMHRDVRSIPQANKMTAHGLIPQTTILLLEPTPIRESSLACCEIKPATSTSNSQMASTKPELLEEPTPLLSSSSRLNTGDEDQACFAGRIFFPLPQKDQQGLPCVDEKEGVGDVQQFLLDLPMFEGHRFGAQPSLIDNFLRALDE
eukprot:scaffold4026_cov117-Cylindrotheca_fusiformis.AAC.20